MIQHTQFYYWQKKRADTFLRIFWDAYLCITSYKYKNKYVSYIDTHTIEWTVTIHLPIAVACVYCVVVGFKSETWKKDYLTLQNRILRCRCRLVVFFFINTNNQPSSLLPVHEDYFTNIFCCLLFIFTFIIILCFVSRCCWLMSLSCENRKKMVTSMLLS